MTDPWPEHDKRVPLSLAVPGWQGRLIPEAVEKVARGVALEQERLRGSRFLMVLRRHELQYDGLMEWVEIVGGYRDVESAVSTAQIKGAQRIVEMGRRLDPEHQMKHQKPLTPEWPRMPATWEGKSLPRFADRLSDGEGWFAIEVNAGVIPTDPDNPINQEVIDAIGMMWETVCWFKGVADKAG